MPINIKTILNKIQEINPIKKRRLKKWGNFNNLGILSIPRWALLAVLCLNSVQLCWTNSCNLGSCIIGHTRLGQEPFWVRSMFFARKYTLLKLFKWEPREKVQIIWSLKTQFCIYIPKFNFFFLTEKWGWVFGLHLCWQQRNGVGWEPKSMRNGAKLVQQQMVQQFVGCIRL